MSHRLVWILEGIASYKKPGKYEIEFKDQWSGFCLALRGNIVGPGWDDFIISLETPFAATTYDDHDYISVVRSIEAVGHSLGSVSRRS